jgi:hypothetical protein
MRFRTEAHGMVAPHVSAQLRDRSNIGGLLSVGMQREALRHLPDEDLTIVGGRGDERVVEGTPANS